MRSMKKSYSEKRNDMEKELDFYDLIIIGGGCAGLTAGIYAGRARLKVLIIEKTWTGGQAAITSRIDNYPGLPGINGAELTESMRRQVEELKVDIVSSNVEKAELEGAKKRITAGGKDYFSKSVIIATGSRPKKLGVPGEEKLTGKGVGYCATCDGFFFKDKDIFVVGGGNSAAEEALYLTKFGKKVFVLVRKGKFKCTKSISDEVMANPKIEVRFYNELVEICGDEAVTNVVIKDNRTGKQERYEAPEEDGKLGVFIFVGNEPNSGAFAGEINLDGEGYIITDEDMRTNIEGVFAAGDVRQKSLRQIVTAASDGAIAATMAEKYCGA